jgi:hypothetical protein
MILDNNEHISHDEDQNSSEKKLVKDNKNSTNYFHIMKEIIKEENDEKINENKDKKNIPSKNNLVETIYSINSEKVGKYYKNNESELKLYGSKIYSSLTIKKLLEEMKKYKLKIIKNINENKKKGGRNFGFESCDSKIILTPLAQREDINNNTDNSLESKNFEKAQRSGVIMRKIEYTHLLDRRDSFKKIENIDDDQKLIMLIIEAVHKIERNWLLYKMRKKRRKENEKVAQKINEEKSDNNTSKNINDIKLKNENKNKNYKENENKNEKEINNKITETNKIKLKGRKNNKEFALNVINKVINKSCFITKLLNISSSPSTKKEKQKQSIEELESKYNELNINFNKIKSQLDEINVETKNLKKELLEKNSEINKLREEISNNKKEQENLIKNNKEIKANLNLKKNENDELNQKYNLLNNIYKKLLNDYNKNKNQLNDVTNNKKLLLDKIKNLEKTNEKQNYKNDTINNELQITKYNLVIINSEKDKKDNELKQIKLDLEQRINKIYIYEKEINNLKSQILEKDKFNEINSEKNKNDLDQYIKRINLLEKEKKDLQNINIILEEISNSNKEQCIKFFYQNKNNINKFNKEKEILKNEISNLKHNLDIIEKNFQKEKNNNLNTLNEKNKYEKKIMTLNKIITELRNRMQDLYFQISFLQKNSIINNNNDDILIKLKLMVILTKNYIDKNIIFEKRAFFNILLKKVKNKFYYREKRIEYLRENFKPNEFSYS